MALKKNEWYILNLTKRDPPESPLMQEKKDQIREKHKIYKLKNLLTPHINKLKTLRTPRTP